MTQEIKAIEALRLRLLENGYTPIRNRDKRTFMKDWPGAEITPEEIRRWSRMRSDIATGIRVENGLAVIDLDIDDREAIDAIADRIFEAVPALGDPDVPLLVRRGKGAKEAWFVRTAEAFGRIHSRAWIRPGESEDAGAHRVEVFGGASPRQFGAFGPHTLASPNGSVAEIIYAWNDRSPADTPQRELPVLVKKDFFTIMDIVEAVLRERGWGLVERSTKGENDAVRVYDLTDDMQFDLADGRRVSLPELRKIALALGDEDTLRCSAGWLEGPSAKRTDRCIISTTRAGHLAIWESASGVTHVEAAARPRDFSAEIDRVAEKLKELEERRRSKVSAEDGAVLAAAKLLATNASCPAGAASWKGGW